ncbi:predicted protein [Naegleria gruberi]|uniref:Predicted protein n=1 Tax=Naegleria gruberi TaxID=5762 RepID=D2VHZ2_NAEGR|nr:uncharacterized protein NAEGRDRAFT_49689 [Naegleria gruberi]EFC43424.1 predicted protein [Naegleria gruberi]|eukprot:XP_002676168.1 predicted protein [Naegleria gruberi strain NEG-M]
MPPTNSQTKPNQTSNTSTKAIKKTKKKKHEFVNIMFFDNQITSECFENHKAGNLFHWKVQQPTHASSSTQHGVSSTIGASTPTSVVSSSLSSNSATSSRFLPTHVLSNSSGSSSSSASESDNTILHDALPTSHSTLHASNSSISSVNSSNSSQSHRLLETNQKIQDYTPIFIKPPNMLDSLATSTTETHPSLYQIMEKQHVEREKSETRQDYSSNLVIRNETSITLMGSIPPSPQQQHTGHAVGVEKRKRTNNLIVVVSSATFVVEIESSESSSSHNIYNFILLIITIMEVVNNSIPLNIDQYSPPPPNIIVNNHLNHHHSQQQHSNNNGQQEMMEVDRVFMMMNNNNNNNFVQNPSTSPPQQTPPNHPGINNYYYYMPNPYNHSESATNNGVFAYQPVFVTIPSHHLIPSPSNTNIPQPQPQQNVGSIPNNLSKSISFDSDPLSASNHMNHFKQKFSNEVYIDEYSLPHYAQQNPSDQYYSYSQFSDPRLWIKPSNSFFTYPLVMSFFNLILLGLGHTLIGQDRKGVSYMLVTMIIFFLCIVFFGILALPFYWLWALMVIMDGYKLSKRLREGIPIHQSECTNKWATRGISQFVGADLTLFNNNNPRECSQEWLDMINHLTTI